MLITAHHQLERAGTDRPRLRLASTLHAINRPEAAIRLNLGEKHLIHALVVSAIRQSDSSNVPTSLIVESTAVRVIGPFTFSKASTISRPTMYPSSETKPICESGFAALIAFWYRATSGRLVSAGNGTTCVTTTPLPSSPSSLASAL